MTEADTGEDERPRTGDQQIDDALAGVEQLEELPVADHHDVLAPAHDQLQQALHRDPVAPTDDHG